MMLLQNYASYSDVARVGEPGQETFPPSCSGWLWLTSPRTARALAIAATKQKFLWIGTVHISRQQHQFVYLFS